MLITLQQIRDHSPCREGWRKLITYLGNPTDMNLKVSIGTVAKSNGLDDALWCLRCADFDRRDIVRCILPSVERAAKHSTDVKVTECIDLIKKWVNGEATESELITAADAADYAADAAARAAIRHGLPVIVADARAADAAAYAAAYAARAADAADAAAYAARAADAAASTARAAADAAARAADAAAYAAAYAARAADAADAAYAARAADAADAAAYAARAAYAAAYAARAADAEKQAQIEDICKVFPCI